MGLAESGKTTIIKVTAEGMVPPKKAEYSATLDYKRKTYVIFGQKISMFDLGGQKSFMDRFIGDLAEFVFTNVSTLVFVVDVANMDKISLAKYYFDMGKKTLKKYSPKAGTYILLHKMDLIEKKNKGDFLASVTEFLELDKSDEIFETNIYDNSIFKAMEQIVKSLGSEPDSLEGVILKFEKEFSEFLDFVLIVNNEGKAIEKPGKEDINLKEIINSINPNIGNSLNIDEPMNYCIRQFNSKLNFIGILNNKQYLVIVYSINNPEILDQNYIKLLNQSIRLIRDINKHLK